PRCFICHSPAQHRVTGRGNRTGNTGRPYFRCAPCNKFLCFTDDRGLDPNNPLCDCRNPSRRQVSGPEKDVSGGIHFVCSLGGCDFYSPCMDSDQSQLTIDDGLVGILAHLKII
ncbi:hypothetical protein K505DRAFT_244526, partial [Melanomma pulvis-pyrius CBS 109.77]